MGSKQPILNMDDAKREMERKQQLNLDIIRSLEDENLELNNKEYLEKRIKELGTKI